MILLIRIMKRIVLIVFLCFLIIVSTSFAVAGFLRAKVLVELDNNFYLKGSPIIEMKYNTSFIDDGFNASLDGKSIKDHVLISSTLNPSKIGDYDVFYTLNYRGFKKTLRRHIRVIDDDLPTINLKCETDIYVEIDGEVKGCEFEAKDNYDGDLNDLVVISNKVDTSKEGDYEITYLVSDSSNNSVTKSVNVHVRDKDKLTYIEVIISKQKLYYYVNHDLVLESPVTTGKNDYTKTGEFRIHNKVRNTVLKGATYTSYVKYWMAYDGNRYGLHDASWRNDFGSMDFKRNGSHGCVNLPDDTAEKLYDMVDIGTAVYIRD